MPNLGRSAGGMLLAAILMASGCVSATKWYGYDHARLGSTPAPIRTPEMAADAPPASPTGGEASSSEAASIPNQAQPASERLLIYDATLTLVVADVGGTLDKLKAMAAKAGGYMQEMSSDAIKLRIPAARFQELVDDTGKLGTVTSQEIKGEDVTQEMWDLDTRLKNHETMLARLAKLAEQGGKVEELVKVEKEIQRVTEEIELIKGRIKFLTHGVTYSTLTVKLNSPVPQQDVRESTPFGWVRELGVAETLAPRDTYYHPQRHGWFDGFGRWISFAEPAGYVVVQENNDGKMTRLLSGENVAVVLRRHENFKGATQAFWTGVIRRHLAAEESLSLAANREVTLRSGARAVLCSGTKTVGRKAYQYLLATVVTDKHVTTFEVWGPADAVTHDLAALETSITTLDITP